MPPQQPDAQQVDAGLRLAGAADAARLAGLIVSFRDFLGRAEPATDSLEASIAQLLRDPNTDFLVTVVGDRAIGFAQLRYRFSLWCSGIEAQIDDFFVEGEARGRGVGAQLLDAAIARARQRGARVVGLTTNERNAEALRLYQRAGFAADRPRWDGGRQLWLELEPQQPDGKTT
jgi:GNAT superfamily N-acetyltransferase